MIEIPPNVFLDTTLEVGVVYFYFHENLRETTKSHFFVVISRRNESVIMVCATTQIAKRKQFAIIRKLPSSTLVEVTPTQENGLQCLSLFDCNNPFTETVSSLAERHILTPIRVRGRMDDSTIEMLRQGVLVSPMVVEEIKLFLR